jgi:predicted DNA-binding protein
MNFIIIVTGELGMKQALATVSFSVDIKMKQDLDKLALESGRSKSDLFREMYNYYRFKTALRRIQEQGSIIAVRLGLESDDDIYEYLNNTKSK